MAARDGPVGGSVRLVTAAEDRANRIFAALADPTRRHVLALVARGDGVSATALASSLTVTRQAILKHLGVLAEAGLVESTRQGREVVFSVRAQPLRETATWLLGRANSWDDKLAALRARAERSG